MPSESPPRPRRRRRLRWSMYTVLGLILAIGLVLLIGRLALPGYLQNYVNRVLDRSPEFDGRVGQVDVHLWRGAYSIDDVKIVKTENAVPVPFFEAARMDLAIDWDALWEGGLRGRVRIEKPRLNFVAAPSEEESQTGRGQPWLPMLNDLFPLQIDRAEVVDGRVAFHTFHTDPPVDIYLSDVQATVENLTNVRNRLDPMMATVSATARAMGSGTFELKMKLDPNSRRPRFTLAASLLDLDVNRLNTLTRAYGKFDFEGGAFDLATEFTAEYGRIEGYAKPLFRDVTVISLADIEEKDDPLQLLWEALVGIVGAVFKNQARDQFGTYITFEGELDDPETNILEIVGNVLRNAFVRAYLPNYEGHIAPELALSSHVDLEQDDADRKQANTYSNQENAP